jgi:NAD(P) transhydrogenase subunit alpha
MPVDRLIAQETGMKLVVPKEIKPDERRVAAVPETCGRFVKAGIDVIVETGAGLESSFRDTDYEAVGARIASDARAAYEQGDLVVKVAPPMFNAALGAHEVDLMREGAVLLGFIYPLSDLDLVSKLMARKITAFAMDCVPRITRAQAMDALSSQTNLAGYKSVLIAGEHLDKIFPMMMTAAGTITPARVFVIGAGVAGLQAIGTARRLGAVVEAYDTRPAVKEQVESLGAKFVELSVKQEDAETAGGYAKQASEEFYRKQREEMARYLANTDAVITTAQVYGKRAPTLITEEMVRQMRPGSVIVDLAAESGGNCELTEAGKSVRKHGVVICGPVNLPSSMPLVASLLYARNIRAFIVDYWKDKEFKIDLNEEVMKGSVITHAGEVMHQLTREAMQSRAGEGSS